MTETMPDLRALEAELRDALKARPRDPVALVKLSALLAGSGRLREAEPLASRACKAAPGHPQPPYTHAMVLRALGRAGEAEAALSRSLQLDHSNGAAWLARGLVRTDLHDLDRAIADFDQAVARLPDGYEAHAFKSDALRRQARFAEALGEIDKALASRPASADARRVRAMLLGSLGRHGESLVEIARAIELAPDDPDSWAAKGDLSAKAGEHAEAIAAFERALALAPARMDIEEHLIVARRAACDWRAFDRDTARIVQLARNPGYPVRPFDLLSFAASSADQLYAAQKYIRRYAPPVAGPRPPFARPKAGAPIRIAYLSSDFRRHAISALMVGVVERHDRSKVEVAGISVGRDDGSPLRRRIAAAFDTFVDAAAWSDARIVEYLRKQEIDVLIDINGLSGDARPGVLAARPAPVQAVWLGYPGTTGAPYVDYVIADKVVVPPQDRRHFSERVVYLPHSYQPNDDRRDIAEPAPARSDLGLPDDAFVYCCFNQAYKITPVVFDRWMRILAATPSSVLWLITYNKTADAHLRAEAERRGVAGERILFARFADPAEHLSRLRRADLFLDTAPYNAHTTTSDALFAGVPVLTCRGSTFADRVAASLLQAAGRPDLIAATPEQYESAAIAFARDRRSLAEIRQDLEANARARPLFDTSGFARDLETAFARMHARRLENRAPIDIDVT